jgi:predicted transposase YdaD
MLQVHDIRETRVYQEAKEEGVQEERQRNLEEKLGFVAELAALHIPVERIAKIHERCRTEALANNPS